ncbi:NAD(P)/FAD-dependent oxidoreductase [Achromobacter xylosoxidans]|uniref:NAD(P)/FAD-dependent oxidoreductase n=1 Tax=Alcaligenes xylosoxydans xylosoxydans TaxID=85698 RepID=UPI000B48C7DC|nr:NAD(P)/FAD-dependent oxidoreductase [Achromobacter xylosoxidans]
MSRNTHRIVIVGGGVAGLDLASTLGRHWKSPSHEPPAVTVTLVDRGYSHIWKPMLHTIAAGTRDVSQQQTSFIAHAASAGFMFQPGEMQGLDRGAREVLLGPVSGHDGRVLVPALAVPYDTLVLAVGSQARDFGTPGVAEHCWKIDSLDQANAFNRELGCCMLECLAQDKRLDIAIVGGGATGVELAAELVQLARIAESYGARGMVKRISITLVDSGPRLLPAFPQDISAMAAERLASLGVTVLQNARVRAAHAGGFSLDDGREVPASLKVWAAGVKAADFLQGIAGLETDMANRLRVISTLQTTLDERIYAMGDCASHTSGESGLPLPPTAQVASQQARYLARHLPRALSKRGEARPFEYQNFGALVSLADYDAYGSLGKFGFFKGATFRGRLAQISHAMLYRQHQARVHGFWRGGLLWMVDALNRGLRSRMHMD